MDSETEFKQTSEDEVEVETSDVESDASSEINYDSLVKERPLEAIALLRTSFDNRTPGARNRELRDILGAITHAALLDAEVEEYQPDYGRLSEPGVMNEPFYIHLSALCQHMLDCNGLFDEHPVSLGAARSINCSYEARAGVGRRRYITLPRLLRSCLEGTPFSRPTDAFILGCCSSASRVHPAFAG